MRYSWRLLLLRRISHTHLHNTTSCSSIKVQSSLVPSLSSLFHTHSVSQLTETTDTSNPIQFYRSLYCKSSVARTFSSEAAIEEKEETDCLIAAEIFTKFTDSNDIRRELNDIVISHDSILKLLMTFQLSPDVAKRFFAFILEKDSERLSSKSYNLMLGILGVNGFLEEFWALFETMKKKKGYGMSKWVHDKVCNKFQEDGLASEVEKLNRVFEKGSIDNSTEKIGLVVSRIVRNQIWGDDVEKTIKDLNITFSSDLVKTVLDKLSMEPMKALIFFRWIQENDLLKHDEQTYNSMALVLGREDCRDRFWKLVDEMKNQGFEMEMEVYVKVLGRFTKRKFMKDAVELYEFAMAGSNRPSLNCCIFLLKKLVVAKELDKNLFSRVVMAFKKSGGILTDSTVNAVIKSIASVGKIKDFNEVFKAMEEGSGLVFTGNLKSKNTIPEFSDQIENRVHGFDGKSLVPLIEGFISAGNLEKASEFFQKMILKEENTNAPHAFHLLVDAYCKKDRAIDAYNLVQKVVKEIRLKPKRDTYIMLIEKLLIQGGFQESLNILGLMKNHGFPPETTSLIRHLAKTGNVDDCISFFKACTSKTFPSKAITIWLFSAFLKGGKLDEAQDVLSKCPSYIRGDADVLELFCSMNVSKNPKTIAAAALAA